MNISVVTPSVRLEMLSIVEKCLRRQTFTDWEWFIVSPYQASIKLHPSLRKHEIYRMLSHEPPIRIINEPEKKEGDFYGLNKAWNQAFRLVNGELIVSLVNNRKVRFNPKNNVVTPLKVTK